jgi:hypothetical protein
MKRTILAIIATFVTIWLTDFLIHQVWLSADYAASKSLWRTDQEMGSRLHFMFIGQLIIATGIALIYLRSVANKTHLKSALLFGLCISLISIGAQFIMFAVAPYPGDLVVKWCVGYLLQGLILGAVLFKAAPPLSR